MFRIMIVGFFALLWNAPAEAELALAVGRPPNVTTQGFVYGWGSTPAEALNYCRGADVDNSSEAQKRCTVIGIFRSQCFAVAVNGRAHGDDPGSTGVGWSIAPDRRTAESDALEQCEAMRQGTRAPCYIQTVKCDGGAY